MSEKKSKQLELPFGTASSRLRKLIIFNLVKKVGENYCFQCSSEIETVDEFSIEHKIPWLDSENPKELFFSLDNIAFSHLKCNVNAHRRKPMSHPSLKAYDKAGCRCDECKALQAEKRRKQRSKK